MRQILIFMVYLLHTGDPINAMIPDCKFFSVFTLSEAFSLERDLWLTFNCISTKYLLAQYIVCLLVFSTFIVVHTGLTISKLKKFPIFRKQLGFFLVIVELGVAILYLIAYSFLLSGHYVYLFDVFFGIAWQLAMFFVDFLVYFM